MMDAFEYFSEDEFIWEDELEAFDEQVNCELRFQDDVEFLDEFVAIHMMHMGLNPLAVVFIPQTSA